MIDIRKLRKNASNESLVQTLRDYSRECFEQSKYFADNGEGTKYYGRANDWLRFGADLSEIADRIDAKPAPKKRTLADVL